jgi:diamine N-acetyltransferase
MKLNYREVDKKNFYEIIKLSRTLTEAQQKCVAHNAFSIGEGSVYPNAYYRGIYFEDKPVGFFMLFIPDEESIKEGQKDLYLWRFMIAGPEQGKHYGNEALDHMVSLAKEWGYPVLMTSCEMGEVSPYEFYLKYGFIDTGEVDEGEQVLRLEL